MAIKTITNYRSRDIVLIPRSGCAQISYSRWRTCLNSMEVSYTQDFSPDDLNHDLSTPKCGVWKGENIEALSFSGGGRWLTKVIRKP